MDAATKLRSCIASWLATSPEPQAGANCAMLSTLSKYLRREHAGLWLDPSHDWPKLKAFLLHPGSRGVFKVRRPPGCMADAAYLDFAALHSAVNAATGASDAPAAAVPPVAHVEHDPPPPAPPPPPPPPREGPSGAEVLDADELPRLAAIVFPKSPTDPAPQLRHVVVRWLATSPEPPAGPFAARLTTLSSHLRQRHAGLWLNPAHSWPKLKPFLLHPDSQAVFAVGAPAHGQSRTEVVQLDVAVLQQRAAAAAAAASAASGASRGAQPGAVAAAAAQAPAPAPAAAGGSVCRQAQPADTAPGMPAASGTHGQLPAAYSSAAPQGPATASGDTATLMEAAASLAWPGTDPVSRLKRRAALLLAAVEGPGPEGHAHAMPLSRMGNLLREAEPDAIAELQAGGGPKLPLRQLLHESVEAGGEETGKQDADGDAGSSQSGSGGGRGRRRFDASADGVGGGGGGGGGGRRGPLLRVVPGRCKGVVSLDLPELVLRYALARSEASQSRQAIADLTSAAEGAGRVQRTQPPPPPPPPPPPLPQPAALSPSGTDAAAAGNDAVADGTAAAAAAHAVRKAAARVWPGSDAASRLRRLAARELAAVAEGPSGPHSILWAQVLAFASEDVPALVSQLLSEGPPGQGMDAALRRALDGAVGGGGDGGNAVRLMWVVQHGYDSVLQLDLRGLLVAGGQSAAATRTQAASRSADPAATTCFCSSHQHPAETARAAQLQAMQSLGCSAAGTTSSAPTETPDAASCAAPVRYAKTAHAAALHRVLPPGQSAAGDARGSVEPAAMADAPAGSIAPLPAVAMPRRYTDTNCHPVSKPRPTGPRVAACLHAIVQELLHRFPDAPAQQHAGRAAAGDSARTAVVVKRCMARLLAMSPPPHQMTFTQLGSDMQKALGGARVGRNLRGLCEEHPEVFAVSLQDNGHYNVRLVCPILIHAAAALMKARRDAAAARMSATESMNQAATATGGAGGTAAAATAAAEAAATEVHGGVSSHPVVSSPARTLPRTQPQPPGLFQLLPQPRPQPQPQRQTEPYGGHAPPQAEPTAPAAGHKLPFPPSLTASVLRLDAAADAVVSAPAQVAVGISAPHGGWLEVQAPVPVPVPGPLVTAPTSSPQPPSPCVPVPVPVPALGGSNSTTSVTAQATTAAAPSVSPAAPAWTPTDVAGPAGVDLVTLLRASDPAGTVDAWNRAMLSSTAVHVIVDPYSPDLAAALQHCRSVPHVGLAVQSYGGRPAVVSIYAPQPLDPAATAGAPGSDAVPWPAAVYVLDCTACEELYGGHGTAGSAAAVGALLGSLGGLLQEPGVSKAVHGCEQVQCLESCTGSACVCPLLDTRVVLRGLGTMMGLPEEALEPQTPTSCDTVDAAQLAQATAQLQAAASSLQEALASIGLWAEQPEMLATLTGRHFAWMRDELWAKARGGAAAGGDGVKAVAAAAWALAPRPLSDAAVAAAAGCALFLPELWAAMVEEAVPWVAVHAPVGIMERARVAVAQH